MEITNQSTRTDNMTADEIGALLESEGIDAKRFWELALGGDVQSLPASVVQSVIDEHEEELRS